MRLRSPRLLTVGRRTSRRGRAIASLAPLVVLTGMSVSAAAAELEEEACPVVAAAQGVQLVVSKSEDLLLSAPTGASLPVAQACVDFMVKTSSGFASNPYPGQTVLSVPGLLAGATGAPIPGYPAYASTQYPAREEDKAEQQGYSLHSRSSETSSTAQARMAAGPAGSAAASAASTVNPRNGSAKATAASETQPLTINDVLQLGHVHSDATAAMGSDGKLVRSSHLTIGHTKVAGQVVEITPEGVKAAGTVTPLPGDEPTDALSAAGIEVHYLKPEQTPRGVVSAGVEIIVRQTDSESGAVYTAQYTLGRSFAAAAPVDEGAGAQPDAAIPAEGPSPPANQGRNDSGVAAPSPADSAPADARAPTDAGMAPAPAVAEEAPSPAVAVAEPTRLTGSPVDVGASALYLVIAFGAFAMFGSGTLLRLLGVKTRWTS